MASEWTVLLVDDEPSVLRGLSALLRGRGYTVLSAANGAAAMRIVAANPVDLAVLDYRISEWRGDVLLASLAAYQPHLSHHTVFITGDIGPELQRAVAELGCPLLLKPFDIQALEWELQRLLEDHPARRDLGTA
jgi:CheY-like chemotaxis protein